MKLRIFMKTKPLKIVLIILLALILLCAGAVGYIFSLMQPVQKNADFSTDVKVEINYGTSTKAVSEMLYEKNLIKSDKVFYICARFPAVLKYVYRNSDAVPTFVLKSGIYHLNDSMNIPEILKILSSGQQEYVKVSIPEGYTISKIGDLLEKNGICSLADFKSSAKNQEIIQKYKIPAETCEGFLFPDTYFFNSNMNSDSVVEMMLDNFFSKTSDLIDYSEITAEKLRDLITLASIVEREYRIPSEAPTIASVFYNRLRYNIGLYSCATIEYIISEINGKPHPERILIEDTKIDSPYNTYKYAGLPPAPISNPGMIALSAAVNPDKTNYYYFQIVEGGEGRHVFSSTFEEHISNHNLTLKK